MISSILAHRRRSASATRQGFTLIELLTVIAIIGILAAIIIPVTGRVRESARQSRCASTQRQIALAIILYATANKDRLPGPVNRDISAPPPNTPLGQGTVSLRDFIQPFMGNSSDGFWVCPSNEAALTANNDPDQRFVYLLNNSNTIVPARPFGNPTSGTQPVRLGQIRTARIAVSPSMPLSRIWLIADIDSRNFAETPPNLAGKKVPPPHSGGRNYAFFDGHVKYEKVPPRIGSFLVSPVGMPDDAL